MLTKTAPMRAVANCASNHSDRLGDQIPTRSPFAMPRDKRPAASRSTRSSNSFHVQRTPCSRNTTACRSGKRCAVSFRSSPIVDSLNGTSVAPRTYATPSAGALDARDPGRVCIRFPLLAVKDKITRLLIAVERFGCVGKAPRGVFRVVQAHANIQHCNIGTRHAAT